MIERRMIDSLVQALSEMPSFCLLGPRKSGEPQADRIRYLEFTPFSVLEPTGRPAEMLWSRGGFPESLLAHSDA